MVQELAAARRALYAAPRGAAVSNQEQPAADQVHSTIGHRAFDVCNPLRALYAASRGASVGVQQYAKP